MSHFYDIDGNARHTFQDDCGIEKKTTPSVALANGWCPSVTTVLHSRASRQLIEWSKETAADIAYMNPPMPGESEDDFRFKVCNIFERQQARAMEFGERVHKGCELFLREYHFGGVQMPETEAGAVAASACAFELDEYPKEIHEYVIPFAKWYHENVAKLKGCICDIKTTGGTEPAKLNVYPEYAMQLAAYADAIIDDNKATNHAGIGIERQVVSKAWGYAGRTDFECLWATTKFSEVKLRSILISRDEPGVIRMHKWSQKTNQRHLEMFRSMLRYWQLSHGDVREVWSKEAARDVA